MTITTANITGEISMYWIASLRLTEKMVLYTAPYHFAVFDTDKYHFEKGTVAYLA